MFLSHFKVAFNEMPTNINIWQLKNQTMHTQIILDDVPRGILGPLEDALHGDFPTLSLFLPYFVSKK